MSSNQNTASNSYSNIPGVPGYTFELTITPSESAIRSSGRQSGFGDRNLDRIVHVNYAYVELDDPTYTIKFERATGRARRIFNRAAFITEYAALTRPLAWLYAAFICNYVNTDPVIDANTEFFAMSVRNTWGENHREHYESGDYLLGRSLESIGSEFIGARSIVDYGGLLPNPVISQASLSQTFAITNVNITNISSVEITFTRPLSRVNTLRDQINIWLKNENDDNYTIVESIDIKDDADGLITHDMSKYANKKIRLTRFITLGLTVRFETNPIMIDFATNEVSSIFVSANELERIKINASTPPGVYSPQILYNPLDDSERCVE